MTVTRQEIVEAIKEMSVLEVSELVKDIESIFGAVVTTTVDIGITESDGTVPIEEEQQTEFGVMLRAIGPNKVKVIKEIRAINTLGLKEAKLFIDMLIDDGTPYVIKEAVSAEEAVILSEKLKAIGAAVEVY